MCYNKSFNAATLRLNIKKSDSLLYFIFGRSRNRSNLSFNEMLTNNGRKREGRGGIQVQHQQLRSSFLLSSVTRAYTFDKLPFKTWAVFHRKKKTKWRRAKTGERWQELLAPLLSFGGHPLISGKGGRRIAAALKERKRSLLGSEAFWRTPQLLRIKSSWAQNQKKHGNWLYNSKKKQMDANCRSSERLQNIN